MRIFITGATGFIGSAVVRALRAAGHELTGLVRSDAGAQALRELKCTPVRGDLAEPISWARKAAGHDAFVHIGFETGARAVQTDRAAVETLLDAARDRAPVVYTSGVLVLGNTGDRSADEDAPTDGAAPMVAWRPAHERLVLDATTGAVTGAVIRPGFVYGGVKGLLAGYFESAQNEGAARFIGDGRNRMALVHRDDLAELYLRVVERAASGVFHGVDGGAPTIAELAGAASTAAGAHGEVRSVPVDHARAMMGPFADALCTDQVVVAPRSAALGWAPTHAPVLEAMRECHLEWSQAVAG